MLLSILAIATVGYVLLGLSTGVAVLLGAILAPTDPVLASGIGAGPPEVGGEGEMKFALTSEAGLNDGMAFPFVALGLALIGQSAGNPDRHVRQDRASAAAATALPTDLAASRTISAAASQAAVSHCQDSRSRAAA
ncbi:MAG TPA: hypothetical protein VFJ18_00970 [Pararhizobium sp.]|nr:hypothetical protein [Pararhizobium sp.]